MHIWLTAAMQRGSNLSAFQFNSIFELNVTSRWYGDVVAAADSEDVDVLSISSADTQEDFVVGEGRTVWREDSYCCQVTTCWWNQSLL